jgi:RimJ/RimL family protein N-acetyltransferase
MNEYRCLVKQQFENGEYQLVVIRSEDRFCIMQWRNEQIYHLRQPTLLTEKDQNFYFDEIIPKLFEQEKPTQVLFSFLKNGKCVGYGGLVHINWVDKNAEISFIMKTELEAEFFSKHWTVFLLLIEDVAFNQLNFHKLLTYAFDLRPQLYEIIEHSGYIKEATLIEHCLFDKQYKNVVIHRKINQN